MIDLLDKWKDPEYGIFSGSDRDSESRSQSSRRSRQSKTTSKTKGKANNSKRDQGENNKDQDIKEKRERFEADYWNEIVLGDDRQLVWLRTEKMMNK